MLAVKNINLARQEAKIRELSGVKEWTPHFSRHIKASFLMQNGVNPAVISGALGHRDLSTINIYATNDTLKASQRANEALKKLQEKIKNVRFRIYLFKAKIRAL